MSMSEPSSATSRCGRKRHDVFLSFRGYDTRNNFISHLHNALKQNWIEAFIDDDDDYLPRGAGIRQVLSEAIEELRIAVVVFSKNYGDSSWCLNELVKIMNCNLEMGLIVLPVFYDVNPSDVRNQTGDFGEGFSRHTDAVMVDLWRGALENVGNFAGWDLNNPADSHEANCVKKIVHDILDHLDHITPHADEYLIGVGNRIKNLMSLGSGGHDVRMIGIVGMGGSGKTTLAWEMFITVYNQFEGWCFVEDISKVSKDHGLPSLQKHILSIVLPHKNVEVYSVYDGSKKMKQWLGRRKVLIVLDNVDKGEQLAALAGAVDWFGDGSRIIITSRDERVLIAHKLVNAIHNVNLLDDEEAIQLFNMFAFTNTSPTEAHKVSLSRVIRYAAGLPFALKHLACTLYDKPIDQWECTLNSLLKCPVTEINKMLKLSLDNLNEVEMELFLDIACFFNGWVKDEVINILDSCELFPISGLVTLKEKSLVTISKQCVQMHNLIQEMGRNVVRLEHPADPSRQSRLWHPDEVKDVLMETKGTDAIKAIVISSLHKLDARNAFEAFTGMKKLRLLHANTQKLVFQGLGSLPNAVEWIMEGSCSLKYLPSDLKWLTWDSFKLESLPQDFHARKLVGLQMRHSSIVDLCKGRDMKFLEKLKFLDLSFSRNLIRTPNFDYLPQLKKLNLEYCSSLVEVHTSIGVHKSLSYLNLRFCENLESFPSTIQMKLLEILDLSGCSKMTTIPEFKDMDSLSELSLSHAPLETLPPSIGNLPNLALLDLTNCRNLTFIPGSICMLTRLEIMLYGSSVRSINCLRPIE